MLPLGNRRLKFDFFAGSETAVIVIITTTATVIVVTSCGIRVFRRAIHRGLQMVVVVVIIGVDAFFVTIDASVVAIVVVCR